MPVYVPARRPFVVVGTATAGVCLSCKQPPDREPLVLHTAPAEGLADPMTMCARCTGPFYGQAVKTVRAAMREHMRTGRPCPVEHVPYSR